MAALFTAPPKHIWIDYTCDVQTDIDTLYALLSDIDKWPQWTPGLRSIRRWRSRGIAKAGTVFLMSMDAPLIKAIAMPSMVVQNERHRIEWGGGMLGSRIVHFMELTSLSSQTTRLRHVEYATGLLAIFARPAANFVHQHDLRWSHAIQARFDKTP
jgi:hypothetical protein